MKRTPLGDDGASALNGTPGMSENAGWQPSLAPAEVTGIATQFDAVGAVEGSALAGSADVHAAPALENAVSFVSAALESATETMAVSAGASFAQFGTLASTSGGVDLAVGPQEQSADQNGTVLSAGGVSDFKAASFAPVTSFLSQLASASPLVPELATKLGADSFQPATFATNPIASALPHPADAIAASEPAASSAAPSPAASLPAQASADVVAQIPSQVASLANAPVILDGPAANAAVGDGGATAAQVQQALDESGLSVNGSGIKVGILSDSFNDLGGAAADEADGALPSAANVQILKDLASGGSDEGRAMAEIVHDIAPGAQIAFYTAFDNEQDFANGILALAAAGCKVICDDVSYFDEPFFQNGIIAQAIQTVEAEGVTFVTAAGNEASNGYQAAWTPIAHTNYDGYALSDVQSFGGSPVQTVTVGGNVPLVLEWNQPYGGATSTVEMLVFQNGSLVGAAESSAISGDPWVGVELSAGTYQIAIETLSGPNPGLIKEITFGDGIPVSLGGANIGTVYGHAMTPGAITAGAVSAAYTPAFGTNAPTAESFSSSGAGTELLFANNGTALFSPEMLNPVAVSGIDDVHTTVPGGLSDFYGTSAASASIAGVAALMLAANPNLTPAQVEQIMEETALPMSNSAVSGAGLVQVDAAVAAASGGAVLTVANMDLSQVSVAASSLFTVSDTSGNSVIAYAFEDTGSGHFLLNGVVQPNDQEIDITAAQLSQLTYQSTPGTTDTIDIRAEDQVGWGSWASFVATAPALVIQTDTSGFGSTSLAEFAGNFFLFAAGGSTGPELSYGSTAVVPGEFGTWAPIGAVQTASGYDIAWKDASSGLYTIWTTDANGNYLGNAIGASPSSSYALESFETIFNQDLNGDGVIGVNAHVIQTDTNSIGSTSLATLGGNYLLFAAGTTTGPELQYADAPVTVGEFGTWAPIGAAQTASGYDVAWKDTASGLYTVWTTDANGNYIGNVIGPSPGNSYALESFETIFNQDLNRDGVVGPPITVIQVDESTSLTEVGPYYFLYNSGSGPELKYGGAAVTQGEFGTWAPIGAVQTASGYDIAWKDASSGLYTIWTTDANGNYLGNAIGASPGNSYALESFETIFDQDLNGDGVVGFYAAPSTTLQISQPLSGTSGAATIGTNAVLEISGTDSATVTFAASTGMLKLDQPSTFSAQIFNFTGDGTLSGSDQIDLKGVNFSTVHDSYANGVLTVTDGTHSAELNFNGSYVLANFKLADDGSGGTIVYDPPVPGPSQGLAGTQVSTDPHNDAFAFHPNLGQSFGSQQEDVAEADHYRAALALATSTTMHDAHEWAIFGQFAYEAIANHDGAAAQAQHHAHFLI